MTPSLVENEYGNFVWPAVCKISYLLVPEWKIEFRNVFIYVLFFSNTKLFKAMIYVAILSYMSIFPIR